MPLSRVYSISSLLCAPGSGLPLVSQSKTQECYQLPSCLKLEIPMHEVFWLYMLFKSRPYFTVFFEVRIIYRDSHLTHSKVVQPLFFVVMIIKPKGKNFKQVVRAN